MSAVTPIETAKRALESVIRRGQDSSKARHELTEAERKAEAEQARQDAAQDEIERAKHEAIRQQADEEIAKLEASIQQECETLLPGFPVDVRVDRAKLESLLFALAGRREMEERKALFAEESTALQTRLDSIQAQIGAIRQSPEPSDAQLGKLHILSLDAADLSGMLASTTEQIAAIELPNTADALKQWNQAARDARFAARHAIMLELESRLLKLAVDAREAYGQSSTAYRWKMPLVVRQAATQGII